VIINTLLGLLLNAAPVRADFQALIASSDNAETTVISTARKGDFQDWLSAIAERESHGQYNFIGRQGFIGRYQFGETILALLGYYNPPGGEIRDNDWQGTWRGREGIDSKAEFLASPEIQEQAMRETLHLYWVDLNTIFAEQGGSLNSYIGRQVEVEGRSVTLTLSGILAATHLCGAPDFVDFLLHNRVCQSPWILTDYLERYGGYQVTPTDFQ
jgi:hypothetical protein